jgi:putative membrane protein
MLRLVNGQFLLAAAMFCAACGGGSKSDDQSTLPATTPVATSEQESGAAPEQTTPPTPAIEAERQPVSGMDPSGTATTPTGEAGTPSAPTMGTTPGATTGTSPGMGTTPDTTGTTPGTAGTTPGTTEPTPGATTGETGATTTEATTTPISEPSAIFAVLHAVNEHEIAVSQLALEKSKNKDVKKFAKMMVDHHKKMMASGHSLEKKMSVIAETENEVAGTLISESKSALERLRGLEGAEFDRAFADQMVTDHNKVIDLLENRIQAASADHRELATMLEKDRPKIQAHLEQAQKLRDKLDKAAGGAPM